MKGTKGSADEGGVRVAGTMRWKGHIQAGTVIEEIAGAIDLLPTFADLVDIDLIVEKPLDGRSLKPLLLGEDAEWSDRIILSHQRAQLSARNQRFRLDIEGKLYDMVADGGQITDVSKEYPRYLREIVRCGCEISRRGLASQRRPSLCHGLLENDPLARARWGASRHSPAQCRRAQLLLFYALDPGG